MEDQIPDMSHDAELMKKIIGQVSSGDKQASYPGANNPQADRAYRNSGLLGVNVSLKDSGLLNKSPQPKTLKLKGLGEPERSDLVKEVLESPPSSLIRWGSTWAFVIVCMLLAISWFVQYPDLVQGVMRVTGGTEATAIAARTTGIIDKLMIADGKQVKENDLIATIGNTANIESIERLEAFLKELNDKLSANPNANLTNTRLPNFEDLGELQQPFQNFAKLYTISKEYGNAGLINQRIAILNNDIEELSQQMDNMQTQLRNYQDDYKLANEELQNQTRLFDKGLISKNELRMAESKVLAKKQAVDQTYSQFSGNQIQKNQKRQEILELKRNDVEYSSQLKQEVGGMLEAVENWQKLYLIKALTDGKLMYNKKIQAKQTVAAGQPLFYILPENANWYGQMMVGQYNIGKLKVGQRVILKFEGYPYQEFGTMDATIASISEIPVDSAFMIKVQLPKNLETNNHKKLKVRSGMIASGEIVTEDLRLLEKIFYEIRRYVKK